MNLRMSRKQAPKKSSALQIAKQAENPGIHKFKTSLIGSHPAWLACLNFPYKYDTLDSNSV